MADRETEKDIAAMVLGRKGGQANTAKQQAARRRNLKKGPAARWAKRTTRKEA